MFLRTHRVNALSMALGALLGSSYARAQPSAVGASAPASAAADRGTQRSESGSGDRPSAGDRKSTKAPAASGPIQVNEVFTSVAPSGCEYSATVRGTLRAVRSGAEEPKYVPNLVVNAWVACRGKTELRMVDSAVHDTPMGRVELEQTLALRGTLLSGTGARRCAYLPELTLGDDQVSMQGLSYLCLVHDPGGGGAESSAETDDRPSVSSAGDGSGASAPPEGTPPDGAHIPSDARIPSEHRRPADNRPSQVTLAGARADSTTRPRAIIETAAPVPTGRPAGARTQGTAPARLDADPKPREPRSPPRGGDTKHEGESKGPRGPLPVNDAVRPC